MTAEEGSRPYAVNVHAADGMCVSRANLTQRVQLPSWRHLDMPVHKSTPCLVTACTPSESVDKRAARAGEGCEGRLLLGERRRPLHAARPTI